MNNNLAAWLNTEVARRGWSLRQLARRAGVSHTTIVKMANGIGQPEVKTCQLVAKALAVPEDELLRMAGILPSTAKTLRVRETGAAYEDSNGELDALLAVWEQLSPADRRRIVDLAQRLAAMPPRIIGEESS